MGNDTTFPPALLTRFNAAFPEVTEQDKDRYGLKTPGDILADTKTTDAEKAVAVASYLNRLATLDLDDNPTTRDVSVYEDGSTIAASVIIDGRTQPLFSLQASNVRHCAMTYPEDHYRVPMTESQCRLFRGIHRQSPVLRAEDLEAKTWLIRNTKERDSRTVLVQQGAPLSPKNNAELRERANQFATAQGKTTPIMWDILNLPENLTWQQVHGTEITFARYPFVRRGTTTPQAFSTEQFTTYLQRLGFDGTSAAIIHNDGPPLITTVRITPQAAAQKIPVRYGWLVTTTDMRALPTDDAALWYATDDDHWQWTSLAPEQPVAILGSAKDPDGVNWLHVMTNKVRGWVHADAVADVTQTQAKQLTETPKFLTVTAPETTLGGRRLEMGTRLRLLDPAPRDGAYHVALSIRKANGQRGEVIQRIPAIAVKPAITSREVLPTFTTPYIIGGIPLSHGNATQLLFKFLGTPWAMANERRMNRTDDGLQQLDCSGIIEKTFAAMGFTDISRNSQYQGRQGAILWDKTKSTNPNESLADILDRVGERAWLLVMPGHVMFYLGKRDGVHWVLHSPGGFRTTGDNGDWVRDGNGRVVITPITISGYDKSVTTITGF